MLVHARHLFTSSCRGIVVAGRPRHVAAFVQDHLCFFRWASVAAILLWSVTLVAHLSYAREGFHPAAAALGLPPESGAPVLVAGPIVLGAVAAFSFLLRATGRLSISRARRLVLGGAAGMIACEALQVGLTHIEEVHIPSYTLSNLIVFALAPLAPGQQARLAAFALALPVVVTSATGYPLTGHPDLLARMSLPLAAVVLGLVAHYWHYGSFLMRRLVELRLARRTAQVERQQRELERGRQIERVRIKWLEQMARFLRHELRNALVGATTSLTLLQRRSAIPEGDDYLERTRQALRVIGALLDSVSDATSIESTLIKETKRPVRLQPLVREQLEVYRSVYPTRSFTLDTDGEDLVVLGRSERLIEVLDNLISNAVDHAAPGTPIEVSVRREDECAILKVANQGPPIPDKQAVFGLFTSFRRSEHGDDHLGLGLYMVRLIADRYGGRVEARDRRDAVGAEFRVMLPAVCEPAP